MQGPLLLIWDVTLNQFAAVHPGKLWWPWTALWDANCRGTSVKLWSRVRTPNLQILQIDDDSVSLFSFSIMINSELTTDIGEAEAKESEIGEKQFRHPQVHHWSSAAKFLETIFVEFCRDIMLYHERRFPVPSNMAGYPFILVDIAEGQNCEPNRKSEWH